MDSITNQHDPTAVKNQESMELTLDSLESHPHRLNHGCEAVRLHRGARSWAAMTTTEGIIGMFGTS